MRKIFLILIGFVLLISCSTKNELVTVKFTPDKWSPKYFIKVPKGYNDRKIINGGTEYEMLTFYPDSSVIYITNKTIPEYNYQNILALGDSVANYRFQNTALTTEVNKLVGKNVVKAIPDTLELLGVNKGLYWKDIKIGKISMGYANVPKGKKELYDKAIHTVTQK